MQKSGILQFIVIFQSAGALGLDLVQSNIFDDFDLLEFDESLSVLPIPVPHSGADNVCFVASYQKKQALLSRTFGSGLKRWLHTSKDAITSLWEQIMM